MFISVLELFKIGIGPSSSHTMGPMVAAKDFVGVVSEYAAANRLRSSLHVRCVLKGSLAFTGKGHGTDAAVTMGLNGYAPEVLADRDVAMLKTALCDRQEIDVSGGVSVDFRPERDIVFDKTETLEEHPNGMVFTLTDDQGRTLLTRTYYSIGGGFISAEHDIARLEAPLKLRDAVVCPYPFDSANEMLEMARISGLSIAEMKRENEHARHSVGVLSEGLQRIWTAMKTCVERGLSADGPLPGSLALPRRAKQLYDQYRAHPDDATLNDWLCAYAMAVNEENAAGNMVVTAPTNGAAGVIPAVLYYFIQHEGGTPSHIDDFLLTAAAIGGIIKHRSSISGAEVGCQGEVGSAASMAAAGLCAVQDGTPEQVENAAEIALEHHLGMTCDPVDGLVQVPCIERNAFGAVKAYTAASLALHGSGRHFMPLDACIAAMKQTGIEMSAKYKETSLGGLAVSLTEC